MATKIYNVPSGKDRAATESEMNEFVRKVDDFMNLRKKLIMEGANVRALNDPELEREYYLVVRQADALRNTIEATTGMWYDFKTWWQSQVTDRASMAIGDAVDWIRSQFGYKPMGGLGAFQVVPALWIGGILTAVIVIMKSMDAILIKVEAAKLQRETGMSRERALQVAKDVYDPGLFGGTTRNIALLAALGVGVWLLYSGNKK